MTPRTRPLFSILCIVLLTAATMYLVGCGGSDTDTTTSTTEPPTTTTSQAASTTEPPTTTTTSQVGPTGPLAFPVDDFTVETKTISTPGGDKEVTVHHYAQLAYVANPIDTKFQALNVDVPVEIDGEPVDAADAPIVFDINVGGYMSSMNSKTVTKNPALAYGYVVVSPGCRGSNAEGSAGAYVGKAPAGIVDLKAAVRYVHYNDSILPGNADWIITTGTSAGGALSALLGSTNNQDVYDSYLEELGAADASDAVYACGCWCPITDLDHSDMAYEWEFGPNPVDRDGSVVDQALSAQLAAAFADYQASLGLEGRNGFGALTAENYPEYLLQEYLLPSADKYLSELSDGDRGSYLADTSWIAWADGTATFTWDDYVANLGRMKGLPAFDDFDLGQPENRLFGDATTDARHYTDFSLQQTSGDASATVDPALKQIVDLMNAMYFLAQGSADCADHWWIRHGAKDKDTALPVIINLATSLENLGKEVNTLLYWDAGHGANEDPGDFIDWIGEVTGYGQ